MIHISKVLRSGPKAWDCFFLIARLLHRLDLGRELPFSCKNPSLCLSVSGSDFLSVDLVPLLVPLCYGCFFYWASLPDLFSQLPFPEWVGGIPSSLSSVGAWGIGFRPGPCTSHASQFQLLSFFLRVFLFECPLPLNPCLPQDNNLCQPLRPSD